MEIIWISVQDSLPNEDEISYTTAIEVKGERRISDKVLVMDDKGEIFCAYFRPTLTYHKYHGKCHTNKYTAIHSEPNTAGWDCTEDKNGWSDRINAVAWSEIL